MAEFVRCKRLRDRDYFDADYDLRFDDREHHNCLYFKRKVIPHDECKETCPGYLTTATALQPIAVTHAAPTRRTVTRLGGISLEQMWCEVDAVVALLAKSIPTEEEMDKARETADVEICKRQRERENDRTPLQEKTYQLESELRKLRQRLDTLVAHRRVMPQSRWDPGWLEAKLERDAERALRQDISAVVTQLNFLRWLPADTKTHGVIVAADFAQTSQAERAYADLLLQRETLVRVHVRVREVAYAALERCSDPIDFDDVSDMRVFLDVARSAVRVPPSELASVERQLRGLRMP